MQISNVSNEDGMACAELIKVLTAARFDNMNAKDAETLLRTKKWVHDLALLMAAQLKTSSAPAPAAASPAPSGGGMKIKNMGSLSSGKSSKKKR